MIYKAMLAVTATHGMAITAIYLVKYLNIFYVVAELEIISADFAISNTEIRQNTVFIKQKDLILTNGAWTVVVYKIAHIYIYIYIYIYLLLLKFYSKLDSRSKRRELSIDGWWPSFPSSRKMSIHMLWYYLQLFHIKCLFYCSFYLNI